MEGELSSAQKDVREESPPSRACLKLCLTSGAVLRHLTHVFSLHPRDCCRRRS